jgi:hypothetical protein
MEQRYKEYDVTVEAERDPANKLFRALIFIGWTSDGVSFTKQERYPLEGSFSNRSDAELLGMARAMDWIDQKTSAKEKTPA